MVPKIVLDTNVIYIITGDKHLLALGALQDIQILTPDVFLSLHPVKTG